MKKSIAIFFVLCAVSIFLKGSFSVVDWNVLSPSSDRIQDFLDPSNKQFFKPGAYLRVRDQALYIITHKSLNPFVVCLQDVDDRSVEIFDQVLGTKGFLQVAYNDQGATGLAMYTFGFSVVDYDIGVLHSQDQSHYGAYIWAVFEDRKGRQVLVVNVDIQRDNMPARGKNALFNTESGLHQLTDLTTVLDPILEQYDCPLVIAGDFNTDYNEMISTTKDHVSSDLNIDMQMYDHANTATAIDSDVNALSIDHVLYMGLNLKSSKIDDTSIGMAEGMMTRRKYRPESSILSDHAPVFTSFAFDSSFSLQATRSTFGKSKSNTADQQAERPKILPQSAKLPETPRTSVSDFSEDTTFSPWTRSKAEKHLVEQQRSWGYQPMYRSEADYQLAEQQRFYQWLENKIIEIYQIANRLKNNDTVFASKKEYINKQYDSFYKILHEREWTDDQIKDFWKLTVEKYKLTL